MYFVAHDRPAQRGLARIKRGQRLQRKVPPGLRRELARGLARQHLHMHHAARHEGAFEVFAQGADDLACRQARRDDKGDGAHHAFGHVIGQPEGAVVDAFDAVEMEVQVRERTALARHVDDVVGAAEQAKAPCVDEVQHIGQRRGLRDVAALHDEGLALRRRLHLQPQLAQRRPHLAGGGAPRRDLAGFGAAVNLDQGRAQRGLGLRGELRRQGCRGREHEIDHGQFDARQQQRLEMERRCHQGARPRHARQRVGDVGGIEGARHLERCPAEEREQHRRLEAVAVLRRHGGHEGEAGDGRPVEQLGQAACLRLDVELQGAPGLGLRQRHAGGARGEQAHGVASSGVAVVPGLRWRARGRGCMSERHDQRRHAAGVERFIVDQGHAAQGRMLQLRQRRRHGVGRQQAHLPTQPAREQAHAEAVAVLAQIDELGLGRQGRREVRRVNQ